MNNVEVERMLDECEDELNRIDLLIDSLGKSSNIVPYLNKYAIIKACGSVEIAYKEIISDFCIYRSKKQVKTYINKKVKENSQNPSYSNICATLGEFDDEWKKEFKAKVNSHQDNSQIKDSIKSLVFARNQFAHGGDPNLTINDVLDYFLHSRIVLDLLDEVVSR
jgi:hypothetical protein